MSRRNSRDEKKLRKLRRAMRRTPDSSIDLVHWLRQRRHAQTAGAAEKLLLDGRLAVDGKEIGRVNVAPEDAEEPKWLPERFVPASFANRITFELTTT